MFNNNKKMKSIVLSMVVAAGMLLPASGFAQETGDRGGLFSRGGIFESDGWLSGIFDPDRESDETTYDVTNGNFGEAEPEYPDAPLGSGIAILIGAGLGYVALKKKEDKQ